MKKRTCKSKSDTTALASEVANFSAIADEWWDPNGKFRPLHQIGPVRLKYICDEITHHYKRNMEDPLPLKGLQILDIGCGGGLLTEPVSKLGAQVMGIDASQKNILVASAHASKLGLKIEYKNILPEELVEKKLHFDAILNMEVVEHVADLSKYMDACAHLVKPGGIMIMSTINRTLKSLALAKFGAEYILRWLPKGTHDWRKFVKPSELANQLRRTNLTETSIQGIGFNILKRKWQSTPDVSMNYLMAATKPK